MELVRFSALSPAGAKSACFQKQVILILDQGQRAISKPNMALWTASFVPVLGSFSEIVGASPSKRPR
jgi:hypothetical protein